MTRSLASLLIAGLAALPGISAHPAEVPAPGSSEAPYAIHRAVGPISIDGRIEEQDWSRAEPVKLVSHWSGDEPACAGYARFLWDDRYIYFACDFTDRDVLSHVEDDGMTWLGDVFEVFLKPLADEPLRFEAHVTPTRKTLALVHRQAQPYAFDKMERWKASLTIGVQVLGTVNDPSDTDQGWRAEVRIPWSAMPEARPPVPGDRWQFAVCRYDWTSGRDGAVYSASAPFTKLDFHRTGEYNWIEFSR